MGLRPGDLVLDPMMGSGTTLVEAAIMGIDAVGFDVSPFCQFMTSTKLDSLTVSMEWSEGAVTESALLFRFFKELSAGKVQIHDCEHHYYPTETPQGFPSEWFEQKVWNMLLLAYFDSVGFAERSSKQTPEFQFHGILERYVAVTRKFQNRMAALGLTMGKATAYQGDARSIPLPDSSVDGILFSPPYSFAVDYVENDASHLRLLGANLDDLRARMIGLRGISFRQKYDSYVTDVQKVLTECDRVLRSGRFCAIVIGTNRNQLSKALGITPDKVDGLDDLMIRLANSIGMNLVHRFERRIVGLANTMREEDILLFLKQN